MTTQSNFISSAANLLSYKGYSPRLRGKEIFVAAGSRIIGRVDIADNSGIWYNCVLRGDVDKIAIGMNTNIQDGTVIHTSSAEGGSTIIGDNVTIGHKALIHACTLESYSFIGMGAIVMDNAIVAEEAMLSAGALLTPGKIISSGELWGGVPAKFMRYLTDEEKSYIKESADKYSKLALEHMEQSE